jgi:DNA-directed RNA polymerase subunit RPC12/RpoP
MACLRVDYLCLRCKGERGRIVDNYYKKEWMSCNYCSGSGFTSKGPVCENGLHEMEIEFGNDDLPLLETLDLTWYAETPTEFHEMFARLLSASFEKPFNKEQFPLPGAWVEKKKTVPKINCGCQISRSVRDSILRALQDGSPLKNSIGRRDLLKSFVQPPNIAGCWFEVVFCNSGHDYCDWNLEVKQRQLPPSKLVELVLNVHLKIV